MDRRRRWNGILDEEACRLFSGLPDIAKSGGFCERSNYMIVINRVLCQFVIIVLLVVHCWRDRYSNTGST